MHLPDRIFRKILLSVCLLLASGATAAQTPTQEAGQTAAVLPGWIVLVLKPIGADRVRPVTGVVVSNDGLIIVPQDFAVPGDQIIVLDGGTDIAANGRAATIRKQLPEAGLTVLSAAALKRNPARLSAAALIDGEEIHLVAFPPAELIAQGAAPVSVSSRLAMAPGAAPGERDAPVPTGITVTNPLPNVSGPLLDSCGNLLGFSSADGIQSMDTGKAPAYLWKTGLVQALQSLGVSLIESSCPAGKDTSGEQLPVPDASSQPGEPETNATLAKTDSAEPEVPPGSRAPGVPQKTPYLTQKISQLSWLGLLAVIALTGLLWQSRRRRPGSVGSVESPGSEPPVEPGQEPASSAGQITEPDPVAVKKDCVVELSGHMPDGTAFTRSCEVDGAAISLVIGRSRADIVIDSQEVHREHARLSGSREMLTITDLGSSRGTWINRVPCLKGEIMFVGAEDTIFLGDVSFQVAIRPARPGNHGAS